jgi:hypothetical protein
MSSITVATYEDKRTFRPGEKVSGKVLWILDDRPEAFEIRLFWYTEGKGTQDVEIVDVMKIDSSAEHREDEFSFTLPNGPYSFSGKLISLLWAIEAVVLPSEQAERLGITVSPTGREIVLADRDTEDPS